KLGLSLLQELACLCPAARGKRLVPAPNRREPLLLRDLGLTLRIRRALVRLLLLDLEGSGALPCSRRAVLSPALARIRARRFCPRIRRCRLLCCRRLVGDRLLMPGDRRLMLRDPLLLLGARLCTVCALRGR